MYWLDKLKWWKKSRGLELQLIIHNPAGLDKRYIKLRGILMISLSKGVVYNILIRKDCRWIVLNVPGF